MIEVYVENARKRGEGNWLELPAATGDVQSLFARIGVDGGGEIIITDYVHNVTGASLGEYENLDELNYLASLLHEMDADVLDKYQAAAIRGDYSGSAKDLINLTQNQDCYNYIPGVCEDEDLGRLVLDNFSAATIPDWIENYFDYEAYGRDYRLNAGGVFTEKGFVHRDRGVQFTDYYSGIEDIPEEYRILPPPPEREADVAKAKTVTQSRPIAGNDDVSELLNIMEANNMRGAKDVVAVINQVSAMEKHLAAMVSELGTMRKELAEAQKMNHPIQTALRKAVISLQARTLNIRDRLSEVKQNIVTGCKNALAAFEEKGLSALRNVADFLKIRPALESLQKEINTAIRQDKAAITKIEKISAEYHEAGRHVKNMGRAVIGKEAIQDVKPMGMLGKALIAPTRADLACLSAMNKCVGKAIGAVERLEKTEHKPPIKVTLRKMDKEIAQAGRDAPAHQRPVPEHGGR